MSISPRFSLLSLVAVCWCAAPGAVGAQRQDSLVVALAASQSVSAQRRDSLPVAVAARVRVILNERPTVQIVGAFAGSDSSRVRVHQERTGIVVGVDWKDIESIAVFHRRRTHHEAFGRGARIGAIVFGTIAVAGITTAIVADSRITCDDYCIPATLVAVPLGYVVTIGGTLVGGSLGMLFQDNWHTVWRSR